MKKLLLTLAAVMFFGAAAADDRPVDYSTFPAPAKEFITKHFAKAQVTSAMLDEDGEYTAMLNDGAKIEFRKNGAWKEVDCRTNVVPKTVIPAKIASYVKANYAKATINKIEAGHNDFEVRLSTGVELKFDMKGNFLRIDD